MENDKTGAEAAAQDALSEEAVETAQSAEAAQVAAAEQSVAEEPAEEESAADPVEAEEPAEEPAVEEPAEGPAVESAAEEPVAAPAPAQPAAAPAAPAAPAAEPAAKKDIGAFVLSLITPERIMGLIAILLIPCFFAAWVNIPLVEKIGVKAEFSMPQALSAGQTVVDKMQKLDDVADVAMDYADQAMDVLEKVGAVASVVSEALNSDTGDRKAALKEAIGEFIDELDLDSDAPAASAALSKTEKAADAAVDKAVDDAAAAMEGTEAQKTLDEAAAVASSASEQADAALAKAQAAQAEAAEAKAAYESVLQTAKTIMGVAYVVWYGFLLLLLVGGILLLVGVRGRYVTGIVAFSLSSVASLAAIIGVSVANQMVVNALADSLGEWVLAFVSSIVGVTAWPWIVAIVSIVCLVTTCVLLNRHRKALKAAQA